MTRLALIPGLVLVAALVGFGASDPTGHVGGVAVDLGGTRLAIDLTGRVVPAGAVRATAARRVVVSPDGRWQAVLDLPGVSGNTGTVSIGRRAAGSPLRIVERHLYAGTAAVAWSPDSRWLALTEWVPHLLSAVAVGTDGRRQVLAAPFCGDFTSGSAWAPSGDRIALGVPAPHTGCGKSVNLRIRSVEGGTAAVVATGISGVPVWSADGRWIATSGGHAEVMRADGTHRRDLGGRLVAWSPRGHVLAVIDQQARTLSVGSAAGTIGIVDHSVGDTLSPSFSPDGHLIAYARDDGIVIGRVAERSVVTVVPASNVVLGRLAWARDGRSLRVDAQALRQSD